VSIWRPEGSIRTIDAKFDGLSKDGRFWYSSEDRAGDWSQRYVGLADAPEGPRYPINPPGTHSSLLVTPGDWVWASLWTQSSDHGVWRFDYAIVDPTTGESKILAVKGHLIAVSPTRALAFAHWDYDHWSGELALYDLASGAKTILADAVYAAAVDPGFHLAPQPNTDQLAPGTRMAFLVRHRMASPYDGLWVTELP
jgi:hypothetical protein